MSEILKKPYEISVWEDELVTLEDGRSYYKEKKVAIIGSDEMISLNKVSEPILKENVNGELTLTFSLPFRYFDEEADEIIQNPLYPLLINERKIKLYYNNKWYDFIIKECEENKEENSFNYTAKSLFVNELSKQGYDITFAPELNNNLGTVVQLGKKTLENTNWIVDEENSDLLRQFLEEPIYQAVATSDFNVKNLDTNELVTISANEIIYIFYSYIANKDGKYLQFLRNADKQNWIIDDHNSIHGINYRYEGTLEFKEDSEGNKSFENDDITININEAYLTNEGYRLVYQPITTYDPVMEEYIEIYRTNFYGDTQDIYKYTTTEYGTSSLAVSTITNGFDFERTATNKIIGWDNMNVVVGGNELPDLELATYPPLDPKVKLIPLETLNSLASYMRIGYTGDRSYIFNSGFMNRAGTIERIAKGEKYVFRIRCGSGGKNEKPSPIDLTATPNAVQAVVAFYTTKEQEINGIVQELRYFEPEDIIFDFKDGYAEKQNIISKGSFDDTKTHYIIDRVVQVPSLKYCYIDVNDENKTLYIWDPINQKYILKEEDESFLNYYHTIAAAKRTITAKELSDPLTRIGIFITTKDSSLVGENKYIYIEDVQIFKYLKDGEDGFLLPGNAPLSTARERTEYYLKPEEGTTKEEVILYDSLEALSTDLNVDVNSFYSVYNENCEKILSISESHSNCFNILQTLCETFECWLDINVEHEENGAIKLDNDYKPIKKIAFKEYIGKDNFAGFKYGINLNSIVRTIDSNEVVTKLIVQSSASDYAENGTLSIALAEANLTGEQNIYNLDYYLQRGLITNPEEYNKDINNFYEKVKAVNVELRQLEKEYFSASAMLTSLHSSANVYTEARETGQKTYNEALEDFENITGYSYSDFITRQNNIDDEEYDKELEEGLIDTVGKLYAAASLLNNNGGITTITREEYKAARLEVEGAKEYSITVSTSNSYTNDEGTVLAKTKLVLSDYIEGFSFIFRKGEDTENFISSLNNREFELETDAPFEFLDIIGLPDNYRLEYTINENTTETEKGGTYSIYDIENQEGRIRRFKLVPSDEFIKNYPGYERRIKEKNEERAKYVKDFEQKYSQFIQEGTWESTSYIDSNLYYLDAVQVSNTSAYPQISYSIGVVEVSELRDLENYNFEVGDKTYIEDTEFFGYTRDLYEINDGEYNKINNPITDGEYIEVKTPIKEEVIISEIEWHLDDPSENIITVQNYKTQFEDLFQRISATVQSVQYNEAHYARVAKLLNENGQIDEAVLVKSLNNIVGLVYPLAEGGQLKVTEDGILSKDLTNPSNYVRIIGKGIQISTDGGKNWQDILTANGITANSISSGSIDTQAITIMDGDNTSFRWDKNGLSAYGFDENDGYDLTSFVRMDKYGLYGIKNGDEYVVTSLDDLLEKAHFSLTWDGFRIKNSYGNGYVSISSDNDFEVVKLIPTRGNERKITKVKIGAIEKDDNNIPTRYGININNDDGEPVFSTDDDGNITITGTINAAAGNIGGFTVGNELFSGEFGESGSVYLSAGHNGVLPIGGLTARDWVITAGENFGVTANGALYATNATIQGTIYATNGEFTGYVNAESGNFRGNILVGNTNDKYITINSEGVEPIIASSDYIKNTTAGWMINGTGDAIFNNVSVRGAIKTAVFEYSEIEAVGGAFLFRPSSSIKTAQIDGDNIILTVEKPQLFKQHEWVKLSNYVGSASSAENDGGLNYVYKISNDPTSDNYIVLLGAGRDFTSINPADSTDYYYYDDKTGEAVSHNPDDPITTEITLHSDKLYYGILENLPGFSGLTDSYQYYLSYNYEKYFKIAQTGVIKVYNYTEEEDFSTREKEIVYIGNLAIINGDLPNTGETFLLSSEEENNEVITKIYSTQEENVFFSIVEIPQSENNIAELEGGALISFGYYDGDTQYEEGIHNYGIGINSSDNYVGLPERAISLFESKIHPNQSVKVTYDYKGILGTLSDNLNGLVDNNIYQHMVGTQGIFTNNMYIGDADQYLAFYTNQQNNKKELVIQANQILFKAGGTEEQPIYKDVTEIDAEAGLQTIVLSTLGDQILNGQGKGAIYVRVLRGDTEIDPIGDSTIEAGENFPNNPSNGDRFILLEEIVENNTSKTIATLYSYSSQDSRWNVQDLEATYEWTFRNKNNEIIESSELLEKFSGAYDQSTGKVTGKCLYLDANVVDDKITAEVKVTIN